MNCLKSSISLCGLNLTRKSTETDVYARIFLGFIVHFHLLGGETKYVLPTFVAADKRKTKYKEHPSDRSAHHRRDTSHGVKKIIERLLHSKTATANGDEEEKNGDGGNNV